MAAALSKQAWTPDNPAPDAVGYLWAWHMQHNRSPVSIRELAKWAGWKNWRARKVLQEMKEQADAWSGKTTRIHTASAQSSHNERTANAQHPDRNQVVTPEKRTDSAQPAHTFNTASAHSRASSSLKTKDTITITENKTLTSDRLAPVRQLWSELNQVRVDLDSRSKPLKLTDARQRTLKARLKEHTAQDVIAVVKWWLQSSHQRAQYLRDNGYGIDTVLRPSNFTTYLELSRVPPPKPKLATVTRMGTSLSTYSAPRRTNEPPALSHYSEGQIAAVKADLEDLQATCKPDTWDRMVRTALAQSYGRA
jgi:hypothetical protein